LLVVALEVAEAVLVAEVVVLVVCLKLPQLLYLFKTTLLVSVLVEVLEMVVIQLDLV
jgi:hypothetical protein